MQESIPIKNVGVLDSLQFNLQTFLAYLLVIAFCKFPSQMQACAQYRVCFVMQNGSCHGPFA